MTRHLSTKPKQITTSMSLPLCKKEMSVFAHAIISFINLTHHQCLVGSSHRLSYGFFKSNNLGSKSHRMNSWFKNRDVLVFISFNILVFVCGLWISWDSMFFPILTGAKKVGNAFNNTICWGKRHEMQQIDKRYLEKNTLIKKFEEESVKINYILYAMCEINISMLEKIFHNTLQAVFSLFSNLLYFKPRNKLESVWTQ